jgi:Fe-Mn family superoxide dismutase
MAFTQPDLPYSKDALAPHISAETLEYHYGKHHASYVKKLNDAVEGTKYAEMSLEEVVKASHDDGEKSVFNNAAQHFNHSFYWSCMSPSGGGEPTGKAAEAIEASFGSFDAFKKQLTDKASGHFGSGWAWVVVDDSGKLSITDGHDADTPIAHGRKPVLTIDVWEHAYYIDRRNARGDYIDAFWKVVNWDFVNDNLS